MTGFFIDDNAEDRARISRLLEQEELPIDGQFKPFSPIRLRDAILTKRPALIALDFRLDDEQLEENNYKAGALAQILREAVLENPQLDFPIVLVSTEENIKHIYSMDKTSHDLFDKKYMKGRLSDRFYRERCHRELLSLVKGYRRIAIKLENDTDLAELLVLSQDELGTVPLHGLVTDIRNAKNVVHVVARILLRQIIWRTGPLLSSTDVAAKLGILNKSDQLASVFDFLTKQNMHYDGVFGDGWSRIWRHRIDVWANGLFGKPLTSISGLERAARLSEELGVTLVPAISKWTGSSDELFAFACNVCEDPTERRNSLSLYDKYLLSYSERKRVCFDCFVRGEMDRFPQLSVDEGDLDVAKDLRSGKLQRP